MKLINKIIKKGESIVCIIVLLLTLGISISSLIFSAKFENIDPFSYSENIIYKLDNIILNIFLLAIFLGIIFILANKFGNTCKNKKVIYIIAFIHFVLGVFWAYFSQSVLRADQYYVAKIANDFMFKDYSTFGIGGYLYNYPFQLPYILFVHFIYLILEVQSIKAIMILNSVFSMIIFVILYKISCLMFKEENVQSNLNVLILFFFLLDLLSVYVYGNLIGLMFALLAIYNLFLFYKYKNKRNIIYLIISMIISILMKSNYLIFGIAISISLILYAIKESKQSSIMICIITIIGIFGGYKLTNKIIYTSVGKIYNVEINKGIPMITYINMGMSENTVRAQGWYNDFVNGVEIYSSVNYDYKKAEEIAIESIKTSVNKFLKSPKKMIVFYIDKFLSTWIEPAFQTIWISEPMEYTTDEIHEYVNNNKILYSFYAGKLNDFVIKFLDIYAIIIFGFTAYYIYRNLKYIDLNQITIIAIFIGGVLFHLIWETKCVYVIPYYIILLPLSAKGIENFKGDFCMKKLKNIYNQVSFYFKKYGLWATIKKCIKKLVYKILGKDTRNLRAEYYSWIKNNEPTEEELENQRNFKFENNPKISIIVPMYNTPEGFFKDLVECMQNQTYSNWELCLADGSPEENKELRKYFENESRVVYKFLGKNDGISGNTNEALKLVTGDYIGLLDHDDAIPEFALYEIVKTINENPEVEFIYTDEDKIEGTIDKRCDPHFKPDFAPDTLSCHNYITHFVIMRKDLMDKLGGFRKEYNGAQDFDLVLRASEETTNIIHIPKVLYHWRVHSGSTAMVADSKPYAYEAGKKAAIDHQIRLGRKAKVDHGGDVPGIYNVQYEVEGNPKVSILIPNKDGIKFLKTCIESILKLTTYDNYEINVIENNSENEETFEYYKEIEKNDKVKILYYPEKGFNYSKIINYGVKNCDGDFVMQLNNDTKLLTPDWLEKFIGYSQRKEIGAVGARLYFGDKSIQHAGIAYGICDLAANLFPGLPWGSRGYYGKDALIQNISAVTGACLFCRRELYEEVGYMEEEKFAVAFNDVDFCLKIREKGYLNIYNPYIELMHYESKTRGYEVTPDKNERFAKECENFKEKWGKLMEKPDPYYNQNLSRQTAWYDIETQKIKYL